jgi:transcriptional regulator with GAF, ATPase, and Fis domain
MSSAIAIPGITGIHVDPPLRAGVLVVSSNVNLRSHLIARLDATQWAIHQAASGAEALERIDQHTTALVLLDPLLPDLRVEDFRDILSSQFPEVELVPINPHTGQPIVATPSPNSLSFRIVRDMERNHTLSGQIPITPPNKKGDDRVPASLPDFIGTTPSVRRLCSLVNMVAQRDTTVLITGESGTGKDIVAKALHHLSPRRMKPFVVINCAAIPEALLEAELFGYVKGAFTGAVQSRIGRIHAAQGGTLFLDEIGDLPIGLQSKLLRFLEQGEIQRLGSTDTFRVDARVVAATNADLRRMTQERAFREDLYFRLSVFPLELPPLRDRMDDLPSLVQHFVAKFCPHNVIVSTEALDILRQHSWPGNVREMRNVIERASILAGHNQEISPDHILL